MKRRTTIEIDVELLARAKRALGCRTTRATVEEALRRAASTEKAEQDGSSRRQRAYLQSVTERVDPDVLASEEMWR